MGDFDVAIIGAGIAGSCLAIRLSQLIKASGQTGNVKVLLLEEISDYNSHLRFEVGESLAAETKTLLQKLNVWDHFLLDASSGKHLESTGNESAWGTEKLSERLSIFNPFGSGYHLDRLIFKQMLLDEVKNVPSVKVEKKEDGLWYLKIGTEEDIQSIKCKLFVDASGRKNILQKAIGIPKIEKQVHDKLLAFIGIFSPSKNADNHFTTLVESSEEGWWYTTLLPSKFRIVVFHSDSDLPICRTIRSTPEFLKKLGETKHVSAIVNSHNYCLSDQRIKCTAANSSQLLDPVSVENGWLAVGDSAMSFDPLSSQGILTAVKFALFGAEAIYFEYFGNTQNKVSAFDVYRGVMNEAFTEYLNNFKQFYSMEKRFPESLFWQRRKQL